MIKSKLEFKKLILKLFSLPLPFSLMPQTYEMRHDVKVLYNFSDELPYIYCNINFDDQSPVNGELYGRDYGGNLTNGVSIKIKNIFEEYPDVAITSFVIPNYLGNTKKYNDKFLISRDEHKAWIAYFNKLSKLYNFEHAIHGFYHHQKNISLFQRHTEFAFVNNLQAERLVSNAVSEFFKVKWIPNGFRQPGWDLSTSFNLPLIALKYGLKYIASNSFNAGFNAREVERVSNFYPSVVDGILNFPQNIELDWDIDKICLMVDYLVSIKGFVSIKGHFVDKDICNALSLENYEKLLLIIKYIKSKYSNQVKFVTLNQFADLLNRKIN